jgi:NAD(P)-dependent dehydrogenase (short-subunit alcohol dehydrogenase family)
VRARRNRRSSASAGDDRRALAPTSGCERRRTDVPDTRGGAGNGRRHHGGAIVRTSSINAWFVEESHCAYNVSKGAVWTFIRSAAIDLGRYGIRVNGAAPGVVDTPLAAVVVHNVELAPQYLETMPLGRFGEPADIAKCVLFLASDGASYITGQTIVLDGGQTLGIPGDLGRSLSAAAWTQGPQGGWVSAVQADRLKRI